MEVFTDLVIQHGIHESESQIAGIHDIWKRAMIISDHDISQLVQNSKAAVLVPIGSSNREISELICKTKQMGYRDMIFVNSAIGITEFYNRQGTLYATDKELIVIDINRAFTDICLLKSEKGSYYMKRTLRVDRGSDDVAGWLLEIPKYAGPGDLSEQISDLLYNDLLRKPLTREGYQIFEKVTQDLIKLSLKQQDIIYCIQKLLQTVTLSINNLIYQGKVKKPVILLSGRLWVCQEAVQFIKCRFADCKVISYRPDVAALLGSSYYLQRSSKVHTRCVIDDNYRKIHFRKIWGEVNRLDRRREEGYWKLLDAVMKGQKEIILRADEDDLYAIYDAISIDYPEVSIIISFDTIKYSCIETKKIPYMKLSLSYRKGGKVLMTEISKKANEILKECGSKSELSCDRELINKVYFYMSKNYYFAKKEAKSGDYPNYAFTLETLLKSGVCQGYAISLIYLFRQIQIPVMYVVGNADGAEFGGHAWNMIQKENGEFSHLDITWDLGNSRNHRKPEYYLLDDIAMRSRRHFWQIKNYPVCAQLT